MISSSVSDWELRQRPSCLESSEALPEDVPPGTVDCLFAALGSEDPHLGDEIAAATLAQWIVIQHAIPADQRRRLPARARGPSGARHRIGESGTTSVFRRSFSILLLAFIHAADNATKFLTNDEWEGSLDTLVSYGQQEQDVRARVSGLGWAHSVAHASDLADELAQSPRCSPASAAKILSAVGDLVARSREPFRGEEEDRVAIALASLIRRGLIEVHALKGLTGRASISPEDALRINWKNIVRALYFRLDDGDEKERASVLEAELTVA